MSGTDVLAVAVFGCFVVAALAPSARAVALAAATLSAVLWIGADAAADHRTGPQGRLVMAFGLLMLAAAPAVLLASDHRLWIAPPRLRGLDAGLTLWSGGIAAIAVGSRTARAVRIGSEAPSPKRATSARGPHALIALVVIVLVSLVAFLHKVGGPVAYLDSLNNSAAVTAGLTYLIWGISFAKYGAFAYTAESWARGARPSPWIWAAVVVAVALLLFVGSRLLVLVALIQLLVLYAALRPTTTRFWIAVLALATFGAVVFLGLGEYRRWENVARSRPSFPSYFVHTSLPQLPRTYVNNYADTVRSSVLIRQIVPSHAPYEDGKEFLRVLLQPLPGTIRPTVTFAAPVAAAFTGDHRNGNALPLPVEGYLEFGLPGDIVFCVVLGFCVGLLDRLGWRLRDVGALMAAVAASTGLVIVFRGSLHNGVAIAGIDVIGFVAAHRLLFRRTAPIDVSMSAPPTVGSNPHPPKLDLSR